MDPVSSRTAIPEPTIAVGDPIALAVDELEAELAYDHARQAYTAAPDEHTRAGYESARDRLTRVRKARR